MAEKIEFEFLLNGKPAIDELNKIKKVMKDTEQQSSSTTEAMTGGWIGMGAKIAAVGYTVKKAFDFAKEFDTLKTKLETTMGSSDLAKNKFGELTEKANKMGVSVEALAESYSSFKLSSDLAGASTADTEKIFNSVITASSAMKLSADDTKLAFLALSQMVSKGTVSMEELRQQFGERIPGAMSMAAQAMGMTDGAFIKAVSSGKILANDLLPKLADVMEKKFAKGAINAADSIQSSYNRLGNAFTTFKEVVNISLEKSGLIDFFAKSVSVINTFISAIAGASKGIREMSSIEREKEKLNIISQIKEKQKELNDPGFFTAEGKLKSEIRAYNNKLTKINELDKAEKKALDTKNKEQDAIAKLTAAEQKRQKAKDELEKNAKTVEKNKEKISSFMDKLASDIAKNTSPEDAIRTKYEILKEELQKLSLLPQMSKGQKAKATGLLNAGQQAEEEKQAMARAKDLNDLNAKRIGLLDEGVYKQALMATQTRDANIAELEAKAKIDTKGKDYYDKAIQFEKDLFVATTSRLTETEIHQQAVFDLELQQKYSDLTADTLDNEASKLKLNADIQYAMNMENLNYLHESGGITDEQYAKMMEFYGKLKDNSVASTWAKGIMDMEDKTKGFQNVAMNAFGGMEDAIMKATKTGKLQFKDMANAILDDLLRMAIRMTITANIARSIGMSAGWMGAVPMAQGGVFDGGGQARNAQGNVFSSPTNFRFAGGSGLLGEKGSEAIMPLKRTTSGDLGVQVAGGSSAPTKVQIINESGNKMEVTSSNISQDNDGYILSVVINGIAKNKMGIRTLMGGK
jgi:tape measure domain-containing protein